MMGTMNQETVDGLLERNKLGTDDLLDWFSLMVGCNLWQLGWTSLDRTIKRFMLG
jgi:hypothetical protein